MPLLISISILLEHIFQFNYVKMRMFYDLMYPNLLRNVSTYNVSLNTN